MFAFDTLADRTTFIVGNGKNSGKTTFLNLAAAHLRALGPVALASVGVDGEPLDHLLGHPKPTVPVAPGDLVVTTDRALAAARGDFVLLHVYPTAGVLGRLVVARARRAAAVELVGPGPNAHLALALATLSGLGARTTLVDGAADRLTQVAVPAGVDASFVEVVRVTPATRAAALERLAFLAHALTLAVVPPDLPLDAPDVFAFPGALTAARLAALPSARRAIVVADFTRVFLGATALSRLDTPLYVHRALSLSAVVINAFDVDEDALRRAFADGPLGDRLVFNPFKERGHGAAHAH